MKAFKAIIVALLFFFAVTFCLQNTEEVTLRYYTYVENVTAPISIVILASVFLGLVVGIIGSGLAIFRLQMQQRRQTKEIEALKDELETAKGKEAAEP